MKKIIFPLLFALTFIFVSPVPVSAVVMMQDKGDVVIEKSTVIDDDLFVAAENVTIEGTVNGDVFVGAGNVRVSGDIKGGLFVATGDLTLTGAKVGGSLVVGSGNARLDEATEITGSLVAGSGDIQNSSSVGRNILAGASTIYQNGSVGKEARLGGSRIELGPQSKIMGNLTYAFGDSQSDLIASSESSVSGETSRFVESDQVRGDVDKARDDLSRFGKVFGVGWLIFSFLGSVVVGLLFVTIFPLTMLGVSQLSSSSLGKSLGTGALITLAMFPLTLALIATIVGIPLAGLLIVVFCISTHIAKLVAAYALGWFIAAATNLTKPNSLLVFLIGLTTFYLLRLVPGLGWLVSVAFTWIGLGAMWQYAVANKKKL